MGLRPRHALIVTGHFPVQKRRANIPWLADHMRANGWHVTFVTVGYSWLSWLRGDRRFQSLDSAPRPGTRIIDATLTAIFGYAPVHPFSVGIDRIDRMMEPAQSVFVSYWMRRIASVAQDADLIVVESGPPVLLAAALRKCAPRTPMVYRASDDIRLLGLPDYMGRAEMRMAGDFDRISVASPRLARRWAGHPGLHIDPIGVPKAMLARGQRDPYPVPRAAFEAVCAGTTLFDADQISAIARACPNWRLHVIGRLKRSPATGLASNVVFLGERSFEDTVAHVRHADVGLAIYKDCPGVEYQTAQSNRILLYRHFRLPIMGPDRLCDPDIPSLIGYDPADPRSIARAAARVEIMGRQPEDRGIPDWSLLYERIVGTTRLAA